MPRPRCWAASSVIPITHDIEIAFTYAQNWPLGAALAVLLMLVVGVLVLAGAAPLRPRQLPGAELSDGDASASALRHALITVWTLAVIVFLYLPTMCITLASLTASRYFQFPIAKWGLDWWAQDLRLDRDPPAALDLDHHRAVRHRDRRGRSPSSARSPSRATTGRAGRVYQKLILLPIFFPQSVLGLALLLWFNALGLPLSWKTAVFAHLVWIVPVVTLVISIQVYSFDPALEEAAFDLGATRWQVLREVTLPVLFPGLFSGALFAFLLSWGNFPLSLFTTGADTTVPEYLYAKMVAGYTPGVPVLGTVSTIGAAILLIGGYGLDPRHAPRQASRMSTKGGTCMTQSLKGRSVVVTGGSKGIGKGIARVFANAGAKVVIVARHADQAEAAAKEIGHGAFGLAGDVTSHGQHGEGDEGRRREERRPRRALRQCRHLPAGQARGDDAPSNGTR